MRAQILSVLQNEEENRDEGGQKKKIKLDQSDSSDFSTDFSSFPLSKGVHQVKKLQQEGLKVFEFFSGIGGMRMALPDHVEGVPITSIHAFDCSNVPNTVSFNSFY